MERLRRRFLDLVISVYLYNEYRGFLQLERDLIPALEKDPTTDPRFLAGVKKHAADERKHYRLFQGWFRSHGRMPFDVGRSIGYFDILVRVLQGTPERFASLCRAVVVTEVRGIKQIDWMLRWRVLRRDARLHRIFKVIRRDEPSHYGPYERWLAERGERGPGWWEAAADRVVHWTIAALVIPALFLNPRLRRIRAFPG